MGLARSSFRALAGTLTSNTNPNQTPTHVEIQQGAVGVDCRGADNGGIDTELPGLLDGAGFDDAAAVSSTLGTPPSMPMPRLMRKAHSVSIKPLMAALEGLTFDTAKEQVTLRPEAHQAICDVNFIRIKTSDAELTMDVNDYARPDVEIAEFVRYDGASVIEAPGPGKAMIYRSRG